MTWRNLSSVARFLRISLSAAKLTRIVRACWAICCLGQYIVVSAQPRIGQSGFTYWSILYQNFEIPDGQQVVGFEDVWLGCRIWNKIFYGDCSDLRVWAGDEAHKLSRYQMTLLGTSFPYSRFQNIRTLASSSSVGIFTM